MAQTDHGTGRKTPVNRRPVSTQVENAPAGFRARLTIRPEADRALDEVFELAPPGRPFQECIRNHWTKRAGSA